jgi:hypothetical protein
LPGFETNAFEFSRICENPRLMILEANHGTSEIAPIKMTSLPREINSSATAEERMTCPDPISREESALKMYLIRVKGMLHSLDCAHTAHTHRRFDCLSLTALRY